MSLTYMLLVALSLANQFPSYADAAFEPVRNTTIHGGLIVNINGGNIITNWLVRQSYRYHRIILKIFPVHVPSATRQFMLSGSRGTHTQSSFLHDAQYSIGLWGYENHDVRLLSVVHIFTETIHQQIAPNNNNTVIWRWPPTELYTFSKLTMRVSIPWWTVETIELNGNATRFIKDNVRVCSIYRLKLLGVLNNQTKLIGLKELKSEHWNQTCYQPAPVEISVQQQQQLLLISWPPVNSDHFWGFGLTINDRNTTEHFVLNRNINHFNKTINAGAIGFVALLGNVDGIYKLLGAESVY